MARKPVITREWVLRGVGFDFRRYEYEIGGKIKGRVYKETRWNWATFDDNGVSRVHGQGPTLARCKDIIERAFA